jgi:hypothetical protein
MSRRKENIRMACNWIDATIDTAVKNTDNLYNLERVRMMNALLNSIKTYTHRIKRTTWRGENKKSYEWKQMGYQVKVKDGVGTFEPLPTKQETRKHFYNKKMVCISCGCSKNAAESMKWDCKDVIKPNVSY